MSLFRKSSDNTSSNQSWVASDADTDRPYRPDWRTADSADLGDGGVCRNPSNKADDE